MQNEPPGITKLAEPRLVVTSCLEEPGDAICLLQERSSPEPNPHLLRFRGAELFQAGGKPTCRRLR